MIDKDKFNRMLENLLGGGGLPPGFPSFDPISKDKDEGEDCRCEHVPEAGCESSYQGRRCFVTGPVAEYFKGRGGFTPSQEDIGKAVLEKKITFVRVVAGPASGCVVVLMTPLPAEIVSVISGTMVAVEIDRKTGSVKSASPQDGEFPMKYRLVKLAAKSDEYNLSFYVPEAMKGDGDEILKELIAGYGMGPQGVIPKDFRLNIKT